MAAAWAWSTRRDTCSRWSASITSTPSAEIQLTMPKVLVTGGAGFIGSHVADLFLAKGFDVTVVDNLFRRSV